MLRELTAAQSNTRSRCEGSTARDVVAHLVGVNSFWHGSITAGLAGAPTRVLGGFDPAATPPLMVEQMASITPLEVLDQFVSTSEAVLSVLAGLDEDSWCVAAESPAGHVPIRLVAQHALWDCGCTSGTSLCHSGLPQRPSRTS